ncbi:MAG TPA: hypothetical protein VKF15_01845 [Nitrososphaerales archaeon]|nr:hypothetical protein [Nitrososphaerales archaeon]
MTNYIDSSSGARALAGLVVGLLVLCNIPALTSSAAPASTTSTSTTSVATLPRFGLDFSWYVRGGFGSLHGVNPQDGAAVYNYLTHGWKQSGGKYGGFFSAYAYELHDPPLYPPQYPSDRAWLLSFIHAANADNGGRQAKIFVRFILQDNLDPTVVGSISDFLKQLGPASQNPSVWGIGFRGAQEGIFTGGGASSGGWEGSGFVPANVAYGPSGMNSFPQTASQFNATWTKIQQLVNSYGYSLGISTSLSSINGYLGSSVADGPAQWFMGDAGGYGFPAGASSSDLTSTYNTWYSVVAKPPHDASVQIGAVAGEWDQNWFILNQPPYYATLTKLKAMFQGFAAGAKANPQAGQVMFLYGMPYLTNDDSSWIAAHGSCSYMQWFAQWVQQYGFFTDLSGTAPSNSLKVNTTSGFTLPTPTGLYMHILGDANLASKRPSYSQTNPVYCCSSDTFTIDGQLTNIATGKGIPSATIKIMEFNFATSQWFLLTTATTNSNGYYGLSSNCPTCALIKLASPPLPQTTRNQAYFYPAYSGSKSYLSSNGVLEDLPVLPIPAH